MTPRQACLASLQRTPPCVMEAALWVSAEHDPQFSPAQGFETVEDLKRQISAALPMLPAGELAQPMLRRLNTLGFQQDDWSQPKPQAALVHNILQRRRGQPLGLAIIALEVARRLEIPLEGVNFPGHFLLRVPGADHLLDPCGGRRLYPKDCRELLVRQFGPDMPLKSEHMLRATDMAMVQRLSRNLRHLHQMNDEFLASLKDADRVLELGQATTNDHLARASLYQSLECPQAERFDLEHALLLSDDPIQRLRLTERLSHLPHHRAYH
ncbi:MULTISPECIES: transglutaminase family protein [unclassified Pseudomonas]|uniref:SirB1 family protein n=1 Tax=unclassified Pseudomonas TaxID=196821 RepID=UPI002AC8A8A9|nr:MULTISPECIES: transglutaminase family protein [unclassified Pseudomonas]MEB0042745.1 transglutaminase family protein [Pseudomonas sp. MH10]MEB0079895.1 transglutaminase family protein [Pseudomonas sp. MH10out]MEB0094117.1 transglutaminase family protein [Pseudomonas sp. CCI4.2]MEB0103515.1 transglutaminase family protein [Pseudomonas sp. CCI3.2]MEB0121656.1 transglutaminase family protein [Pseudomonas sp. CCI1.2]